MILKVSNMGFVERLRGMVEISRLHSDSMLQHKQLSMHLAVKYRRAGLLIITSR